MYYEIDKRKIPQTNGQKFRQFLDRTFSGELFVGLWVVFREMVRPNSTHTFYYPQEKMEMVPRYRSVHKLLRFAESGNERCIGCGLCAKICVSNCINMETSLGADGRKKVDSYTINFGRCVYCGLCVDACPELAIVHGPEYEFTAEQRAYFGGKEDLLTPLDKLKEQSEFSGYGSVTNNYKNAIKATPNAYFDVLKGDENV